MWKALEARYGEDHAFWPQTKLFAGNYCLIMFEGLNASGSLGFDVADRFENDFIQSLATYLPVIAMATYGTEKMLYHSVMANHVGRNMPLFLLDSRKRVVPTLAEMQAQGFKSKASTLEWVKQHLQKNAERLHAPTEGGRCAVMDFYSTSLLAFVKSAVDFAGGTGLDGLGGDVSEDEGKKDQKERWIWQAI